MHKICSKFSYHVNIVITYAYIKCLLVALSFSHSISMEIGQHTIALLSSTESCTNPSDSFTLNVEFVNATVTLSA